MSHCPQFGVWLSLLSTVLTLNVSASQSTTGPKAEGMGRSAAGSSSEISRPKFTIATTEQFDVRSIPKYLGSHDEIYEYIDSNLAQHLKNLRRWVSQPSVSAENRGIHEMAEMLKNDLKELGFDEAEVVPTSGHPGVWGYYDADAEQTLAIYMMYDVQPVDQENWQVDAFGGVIVEAPLGRVLMARGAINQKGPERAFLNALDAVLGSGEQLPMNLMILAEGEEELGSTHYPELVEQYADRLRTATGVLFPRTSQTPDGSVSLALGTKGIVYFELEARGSALGGPTTAEIHGSFKAITDSPVWRLTQALTSMTTSDGNTILVPGYYDAIRPPTLEEQRLVNGMLGAWTESESTIRESLGVERWMDGISGRESLMEYLFGTSLNIDGLWSGYIGPGTKTILPHTATAKLDSRLVPNQTPEESLKLIRQHLDKQGFSDIEIRRLAGYPPAQTSVKSSFVRAAISVFAKYDQLPAVAPRVAGSAPYYVFTEGLNLPLISAGLGHGSGMHAPNEYMVIEPRNGSTIAGLAEVEKFYVDLLYAIAEVK